MSNYLKTYPASVFLLSTECLTFALQTELLSEDVEIQQKCQQII